MLLKYWFSVYKEILFFNLVLHPIRFHIHFLGNFSITVPVIITSETDLSVFIGVDGWGKPISLRVMRRGAAVCPLWKSPLNYDLAVEATTCLSIMHSVWIGPFSRDESFVYFLGLACRELS